MANRTPADRLRFKNSSWDQNKTVRAIEEIFTSSKSGTQSWDSIPKSRDWKRSPGLQSLVLSQSTPVTDGQTDRTLIARPRLHSMQRGKKLIELTSISICYLVIPENCAKNEKLHKIDRKIVLKLTKFAPKLHACCMVMVYKHKKNSWLN